MQASKPEKVSSVYLFQRRLAFAILGIISYVKLLDKTDYNIKNIFYYLNI